MYFQLFQKLFALLQDVGNVVLQWQHIHTALTKLESMKTRSEQYHLMDRSTYHYASDEVVSALLTSPC